MDKNFNLILENDKEWQTLKIALSNYLFFTSCFADLEDEYLICQSFFNRLGVELV